MAWISRRGIEELGISLEEITKLTSDEYHLRYFNAEDAKDYVPKIIGLLERNNRGSHRNGEERVSQIIMR